MKKIVSFLLIIVMLCLFVSCNQRSSNDLDVSESTKRESLTKKPSKSEDSEKEDERVVRDIAILEEANYYTATASMDDFYWESSTPSGSVVVAFFGVEEEHCDDWDGDAIIRCQNFVWAFYFETEEIAETRYDEIATEYRDEMTAYFEEIMEDPEEAAADGFVEKVIFCERKDAILYLGTRDAINLVRYYN